MFINSFIKDIGLKPFVLPEGLTVPLTPGRVDGLVVLTVTTVSKLPPAFTPLLPAVMHDCLLVCLLVCSMQ